jgi:hypothetical protein
MHACMHARTNTTRTHAPTHECTQLKWHEGRPQTCEYSHSLTHSRTHNTNTLTLSLSLSLCISVSLSLSLSLSLAFSVYVSPSLDPSLVSFFLSSGNQPGVFVQLVQIHTCTCFHCLDRKTVSVGGLPNGIVCLVTLWLPASQNADLFSRNTGYIQVVVSLHSKSVFCVRNILIKMTEAIA